MHLPRGAVSVLASVKPLEQCLARSASVLQGPRHPRAGSWAGMLSQTEGTGPGKKRGLSCCLLCLLRKPRLEAPADFPPLARTGSHTHPDQSQARGHVRQAGGPWTRGRATWQEAHRPAPHMAQLILSQQTFYFLKVFFKMYLFNLFTLFTFGCIGSSLLRVGFL